MNKFLISFICFLCFNFSYELECSQLTGATCQGHNTNYKLSCHQFSTNDKCVEVEVDDGCKINESNQCVITDTSATNYLCYAPENTKCKKITFDKGCSVVTSNLSCNKIEGTENIKDNEDCFWSSSDKKYCQILQKKCELYSNINCGGFKKIYEDNNNKQCIQLQDNTKCYDITLDANCEFDDSNKKCTKRSTAAFDDKKKMCDFNEAKTECKIRDKNCDSADYDYDLSKCSAYGTTCHRIENLFCKIIPDNDYCQVDNSDGKCKSKSGITIQKYQECSFDDKYTKCEPVNKVCSEIIDSSLCSYGRVTNTDYECKKIDSKCQEIKIVKGCKLTNEEKCEVINQSDQNNNKCKFTQGKSICQFYQVDLKCSLNTDTFECSNNGLQDESKICALVEDDFTQCKVRDKICSDFKDETACETGKGVKTSSKKCSWSVNGYSQCKEFEIEEPCTVKNWQCAIEEGKLIDASENKVCYFDYLQTSCKKRDDVCTSYYANNKCAENKYNTNNQKQCYSLSEKNYCEQINIDQYCHVVTNNLGGTFVDQCVKKDGKTLPDKKICDFINGKTTCQIRDMTCKDYISSETCNAAEGCVYLKYYSECYAKEAITPCKISNQAECEADGNIENYEKCDFIINNERTKATCQKRDILCQELDSSKCNSFTPKAGSNYECYHDGSICYEITSDGKCKANKENRKCEKIEGKLGSNEVCVLNKKYNEEDNSYYYHCEARNKDQCSDYDDKNCGDFTPEAKLCFNFNGNSLTGRCKEVKIDSQCSINDKNECTGNGCSFDDKKDRCFYTEDNGNNGNNENNGTLLKLKRFILLTLVFIF